MFVTSSVKAEGDQPAEPRWERAIYLFEDVTLIKQNHTHRLDHTEYVIVMHHYSLSTSKTNLKRYLRSDVWNTARYESFTLPKLSDSCCDVLHGEADQVVFRTLLSKLFWFL